MTVVTFLAVLPVFLTPVVVAVGLFVAVSAFLAVFLGVLYIVIVVLGVLTLVVPFVILFSPAEQYER